MTAEEGAKPSGGPAGISLAKDGVSLWVKVVPRASRSKVEGIVEGALKVRVAAPPSDGEANEELIRILSKFFKSPKTAVKIVSGGSSRRKRVTVGKTTLEEASKLLASLA